MARDGIRRRADKERDIGLAILGWERLRFTDRAIERRLRVLIASVQAVLDLRQLPHPPAA
jgi:very-short-patch-repair endonuclease